MSDHDTLLEWLQAAEQEIGEMATHVFLEKYDGYNSVPDVDRRLLTRQEFASDVWASLEFDSGFGGAGCPAIIAWTPGWLFYTHEYDGATSMHRLPRGPAIPEKTLYYGDVCDW